MVVPATTSALDSGREGSGGGAVRLGGTLPEMQDRMCIMVAVVDTLEVPLQSPLGDRVVTAGA